MAASRVIAAFDLDGTLTYRDTLLPFLARTCGRGRTCQAVLAETGAMLKAVAGLGSRDVAKQRLLVRLLSGRPLADLERQAEAFADHVVGEGVRTEVVALVDHHRREGHELVLVSASPELYVAAIGRRLGFAASLGTRLEVDAEGRLTGRLDGRNCRGQEKVDRLRAWVAGEHAHLYAYGDSAGDRELLAMADTPVMVGKRRLGPAQPAGTIPGPARAPDTS